HVQASGGEGGDELGAAAAADLDGDAGVGAVEVADRGGQVDGGDRRDDPDGQRAPELTGRGPCFGYGPVGRRQGLPGRTEEGFASGCGRHPPAGEGEKRDAELVLPRIDMVSTDGLVVVAALDGAVQAV